MKEKATSLLFKHLTPQEISWMLTKWQPHNISESTIIIKQGTEGDEMFIIDSGRVEVYLTHGEVVFLLSELGEPSFFGELAFLTGKPRMINVKARTDCRLLGLKKQDFLEIIDENPKVAAKFLLAIAENLSNQVVTANSNVENHFLVNQKIVDNELFKKLYILTHQALSSRG